MHGMIVAGCFILLILIPCIVAVFSSSKEGRSGNSGEHEVAQAPERARGHSPSRVREAAAAMAARKEAKLAAETAAAQAAAGERPSRIRMAAVAAFTQPEANASGERPSRVRKVAAALKARPQKPVPMAAGDPGAVKPSIRDLRAKHATTKSSRS